jgi:protein TonB
LQPRNDRSDDTDKAKKPTPDRKPESNKTLQLVSRVDVKSASKSLDSEKPPSPTSQIRAVTSLPSKGDSGRRATTSGCGKGNYFDLVRRKIAETKLYPTEAANEGSEGTAVVGFDLHRNGTVSNVRVLKSSLSGILDLEARKTVQRAAPFPEVPAGIKGEPLNMRIPLSFEIVKR